MFGYLFPPKRTFLCKLPKTLYLREYLYFTFKWHFNSTKFKVLLQSYEGSVPLALCTQCCIDKFDVTFLYKQSSLSLEAFRFFSLFLGMCVLIDFIVENNVRFIAKCSGRFRKFPYPLPPHMPSLPHYHHHPHLHMLMQPH